MTAAQAVVLTAAMEYRIDVHLAAREQNAPVSYSSGPRRGAGISFKKNSMIVAYNASPADILHELAHLVVGRPSTWLSEGFVLMPFEWELARYLSKEIKDPKERKAFMQDVREYQDCTQVGILQFGLDDFGSNVRRMKWWRRGVDRARRLGLLYTNNEPTFLPATWEGSGVPARARGWDPDYDKDYP